MTIFFATLALSILAAWWVMIRMPGKSFAGELPAMTASQTALAAELRGHLTALSVDIGPRHTGVPRSLAAAAAYIRGQLRAAGLSVQVQTYEVGGVDCDNLEVEIAGTTLPAEIVVIGAHYDSVPGCPAANDNGTGVAALIALADRMQHAGPARTLRFVAFVNEEPPHFHTENMGSLRYARRCRERNEDIVAMISLETLGYFSDEPGSQKFPSAVLGACYPTTGNYITFIGNVDCRRLVHRTVGLFREHARFPCEGAALPGSVSGIGWSDHWAFWEAGYPAVMVTDTAPFRYPHYHESDDTIDKIDIDRLARVTGGLQPVIADLAGAE